MMRHWHIAISITLLAGNAVAAGIELNKDAVSVSAPDPQGQVVIVGAPGCVLGPPPIYISAKNKNSGMAVNASAFPDGGFQLRIPARGEDSVKITFTAANGKKKELSVKIRGAAGAFREGAASRRPAQTEVNVDLGQLSQFGAPEVVQVKPDGRGGTRVHVGRRPPQPIPAGTPAGTAASPPTPSPETVESPPALPGTGEVIMPNNTPSHPETDRSPSRRME